MFEVLHTRQFLLLLTYVVLKIIFSVVQMFVLGQISLLNVFRTLYINGIFIFNFLPAMALVFLVYDRFRRFNKYLESTLIRCDFKQVHSLASLIFDIVNLMGQALGPEMLITMIVFWISGIFANFSGFEVYILRNPEYELNF